jgi:HEAT repeat protein
MIDEKRWLSVLEDDLKKKIRRDDPIPDLSVLVRSADPEIKNSAVWCTAKLAQNKTAGQPVFDILIPLHSDADPQVRENVAWGIGEISGTGLSDSRSVRVIVSLLSDEDRMVRGMAAWAAGRLIHRLGVNDPDMVAGLRGLEDDPSEYVRKAAGFALSGG